MRPRRCQNAFAAGAPSCLTPLGVGLGLCFGTGCSGTGCSGMGGRAWHRGTGGTTQTGTHMLFAAHSGPGSRGRNQHLFARFVIGPFHIGRQQDFHASNERGGLPGLRGGVKHKRVFHLLRRPSWRKQGVVLLGWPTAIICRPRVGQPPVCEGAGATPRP